MSSIPPVRREIVVEAQPGLAFEVFTDQIGTWWPLAELSVHGGSSTVGFVDGEIVETAGDGQRAVWGTVTDWQPGERVAFTWHPGKSAEAASRVAVSFVATEGRTLVTLVHDGWEVFADPASARDEYNEGWPAVLTSYSDRVTESGKDEDDGSAVTWVALMHRPGPKAPSDGSLFAAPGFADHMAFLARMSDAGYLVAAGPLLDEAGHGMTVLRLPGADRIADAHELATHDDRSVADGFFTVQVRPWQVMVER